MQEISLETFMKSYQPEIHPQGWKLVEGKWTSEEEYDAVVNTPSEYLWCGDNNILLSVVSEDYDPEFYVITRLSHLGIPTFINL